MSKPSTSIAAIIGIGANSLEIPLIVCKSAAAAHTYLTSLGLKLSKPNTNLYDVDEVLHPSEDGDEAKECPVKAALFKDADYYDGCGGCYQLEVREITFNAPIIGWDLD